MRWLYRFGIYLQFLLRRLSKRGKFWLLVISLAFVAMVDVLESFELEERSDAAVANALGMLWGPVYGWADRLGQKNITLVVYQQNTLDALGQDKWPPTYDTQSKVVRKLAEAGPKALFLDFYYAKPHGTDPKRGIENLSSTLANVRANGLNVILGPVDLQNPLFEPLHQFQRVGIRTKKTPSYAYPYADRGMTQAAFVLYKEWCERESDGCEDLRPAYNRRELAVQWGFGTTPLMARWQPALERGQCESATGWQRFQIFASVMFKAFARAAFYTDEDDPTIFRCPYFDTIPAEWLFEKPSADFDAEKFLKDRIVLVGADLRYLADYASVPLLGDVPGVTVHAMALDNLMENGARAQRHPKDVFWGIDEADIVEVIMVVMGVVLVRVISKSSAFSRSLRRTDAGDLTWGAKLLILLFIAVFGMGVGVLLFHWPPVNVLAVMAAGSFILFLYEQIIDEENADADKEADKEKVSGV